MSKITLSKVYNLSNKEVNVIELDFDNMTGRDFLDCEKEYKTHTKGSTALKEFEDKYVLTVAAKASGIRYSDFKDLSGVDYMKVLNQTKSFLNKGWESEDEDEENETETKEDFTAV